MLIKKNTLSVNQLALIKQCSENEFLQRNAYEPEIFLWAE